MYRRSIGGIIGNGECMVSKMSGLKNFFRDFSFQSLKLQNGYLSEVLLESSRSFYVDLETDGAGTEKSLRVSIFLKDLFIRTLGSS